MIFQERSCVPGHVQGFLPHLLADKTLLKVFQALTLPGVEVSQGVVEVILTSHGKKARRPGELR